MSGQFSAALMFLSLAAICLAANQADEGVAPRTREPASKEAIIGAFRLAPALPHTEKMHGPLTVTVQRATAPGLAADEFILEGSLSTRQDLPQGCDYTWSLPEGVTVVEGAVTGHVGSLAAGTPLSIRLTLRRTTDHPPPIHLMASASAPTSGLSFAHVAHWRVEDETAGGGSTAKAAVRRVQVVR